MNSNQNQMVKKPTNAVSAMTTFLTKDAVKEKINAICGQKEGDKLISNLVSNIQQNPALAECTQGSVVNAALAGHALKLDFALQQAYMIPFNNKKKNCKDAQFCIGWKGYVQLAIRSGQYRKINAIELKEGELKGFNRLTEEYEINFIEDDEKRVGLPTTHYVAYIELINGFRKTLVWTKEKMTEHAKKYSMAFQNDLRFQGNSSFWTKDFDSQAKKTMLRQIISKYGAMSTEMQTAFRQDMAVLGKDGAIEYVDTQKENLEAEVVEESPRQTIVPQEEQEEPQEPTEDDIANLFA